MSDENTQEKPQEKKEVQSLTPQQKKALFDKVEQISSQEKELDDKLAALRTEKSKAIAEIEGMLGKGSLHLEGRGIDHHEARRHLLLQGTRQVLRREDRLTRLPLSLSLPLISAQRLLGILQPVNALSRSGAPRTPSGPETALCGVQRTENSFSRQGP